MAMVTGAWMARDLMTTDAVKAARATWDTWSAGLEGDARYDAFADLWSVKCAGDVTTTCREAVATLVALCPELKAIRGQVVMKDSPDGDTRPWPHWWAVTADGVVVDPTAAQFPSQLEYRPHDESKGPPTGKCPNCGGLCHNHNYCCSDKCEREYVAYVNGEVKDAWDNNDGWDESAPDCVDDFGSNW